MAEKTKRGNIPSIKVTKDFLKDLGVILESEVKERNESAKALVMSEIEKGEQEIEARTYYKDQAEKDQAKEEMRGRVRDRFRPHVSLNYSIDARNEDLTFSSIDEIIDTRFFPEKIESVACSVSHYGENEYVDVNINISQRWLGISANYKLSSSSEKRLLKMESDLKNLFRQNPTKYKILLYPTEISFYIVPRILSVFLAVAASYLSYQNFGEELKSDGGATATVLFWIFIFAYWFTMELVKLIFPYFKFEITNEDQLVSYVRIAVISIISAIILGAIYDYSKSLFI